MQLGTIQGVGPLWINGGAAGAGFHHAHGRGTGLERDVTVASAGAARCTR